MLDAEVYKMLARFGEQFLQDMVAAKELKGLTTGYTDVEIARCVIRITAEKFGPVSDRNKTLNIKLFRCM